MDYQGRQIKQIGSFIEGQNMTYTVIFENHKKNKKDFQEAYKKILILFLHYPLKYELASIFMCSTMHMTVLKYFPQKQKNKARSKSSLGKEF